jgi:hypothetical protein
VTSALVGMGRFLQRYRAVEDGLSDEEGEEAGEEAGEQPGMPRPRVTLVAGNAEQVSPVVGELVQVVEGARGLPQERCEQSPAGREEHEQRQE